jgi:glutamate racemase
LADKSLLPIGVFDSGLGGLTVLKALRLRFPHEHFIYLGDTARIPYGSKSPRTIQRYLELNLKFLEDCGVKAAVIACNSASTQASQLTPRDLPIYNVIDPSAKKAAQSTQNGKVGVIATRATVQSGAYVRAVQAQNPDINVTQQACPLLVPLVEEGWDDDPITNLVVYRYLSPLMSAQVDTLILGCTHFPILKSAITKVTGPRVELIESSQAIADLIEQDFQSGRLTPNHSGAASELRVFTTDVSDHFQALAQKIISPQMIKQLELADI